EIRYRPMAAGVGAQQAVGGPGIAQGKARQLDAGDPAIGAGREPVEGTVLEKRPATGGQIVAELVPGKAQLLHADLQQVAPGAEAPLAEVEVGAGGGNDTQLAGRHFQEGGQGRPRLVIEKMQVVEEE